jgi:hypothetical protein
MKVEGKAGTEFPVGRQLRRMIIVAERTIVAIAAFEVGGKFARSLNDPKARWARGRCYFEANTDDASGQSSPITVCDQEALSALA